MAQLVEVSFCTPKGGGFDCQSGRVPRLMVDPQLGHLWVWEVEGNGVEAANRCFSHINVSLSLFLPCFLSLKKKINKIKIKNLKQFTHDNTNFKKNLLGNILVNNIL